MNIKGSEKVRVIFGTGYSSKQSTSKTTAVQSTAWVDMQNWQRALVIALRLKGTGNIRCGVYASAASTGTSPAAITTQATTAATKAVTKSTVVGTILKPGVGRVVFDVSAEEIENAVASGRYISLRVRKLTRADKIGAIYILLDPRTKKATNMGGINYTDALTN